MTRNVAIVLFEDAEELDWVGPWEVFTVLTKHVEVDSCNVYTVSEKGGQTRCAKGLRVLADYSFADCPKPDIFVVPGGQGTRIEMDNPAMLDWVRASSATAELSTSVCTGAFVLGRAGLLRGKRATTHWGSMAHLQGFEGAQAVEARWVDEGNVITASGVSAGIDMALHVVGRLWSPEVARKVQLGMEYFPDPPYQDTPMPAFSL